MSEIVRVIPFDRVRMRDLPEVGGKNASLGEMIGELRASSQLIVITHQKRTMEVADALYGVSMRGDGITQVISQKIRESA